MSPEPVEFFYSYFHKDEKLRDGLAVHLTMLQRQGVIRNGQRSVYLNLQSIDMEFLNSIDQFLQWFYASVANELELDDRAFQRCLYSVAIESE